MSISANSELFRKFKEGRISPNLYWIVYLWTSRIWGRQTTKKRRWKRTKLSNTEGFIKQAKFYTILREKNESGNPARRVSPKAICLNFVKQKHTRRNFERQLSPKFKRVTEGSWIFSFKLVNYQTIAGAFANSYTCKDIVRKEKQEWDNFSGIIRIQFILRNRSGNR